MNQPQWSIQRRTVAHRDGERRLDQAYQHLLRWAQELSTAPQPQEANHALPGLIIVATGVPVYFLWRRIGVPVTQASLVENADGGQPR